jgi:O-succinylbenzoic acid--CoA ligase
MTPALLLHGSPREHLAAAMKAIGEGRTVVLGNPRWSAPDLRDALALLPAGTAAEGREERTTAATAWRAEDAGAVLIPTGGTGGQVRFAVHRRASLRAAALALRDHLESRGARGRLHCVSLTPPWHVSGLMPAVRAEETGGRWAALDGSFRPGTELPEPGLPADGTRIASLVPAQLLRAAEHPAGLRWLGQFDVILLGGGAVDDACLALIRRLGLPVHVTYGMTETAAACALCAPEDLPASGAPEGRPLPGVRFERTADGRLTVDTPALAERWWGGHALERPYVTGDLGAVGADGRVRVTGRGDRIVVTGGEKVDPARVERALADVPGVRGVHVFGQRDPRWGERLVACVAGDPSLEPALRARAAGLEPPARPKAYAFMPWLPADSAGKFDRAAAEAALRD